ncbi:hypothetical protein GCM10010256_07630 [Streptomyces coeruleorubidus]|nr:hypothetical protein GCM10010256_07630 [Streptomyces coeruleorubidus]GGU18006.1 hypothetical protein GCM10010244_51010 [Streptomyces bellus]
MAGAGEQGGEQTAHAAGTQDGHGEFVPHVGFLSSVGPTVVAASWRSSQPSLSYGGRKGQTGGMCRSIKTLRPPAMPEEATDADIRAAALQYVRKVSGFRAPAAHNQEVFERAVEAVAQATAELLDGLEIRGAGAQRAS